MLGDGVHDVPPGKIAAVVTHLEMRAPPAERPANAPDNVTLTRVTDPAPDWYRDLFRRIGSDWLWFSRLGLTDTALSEAISGPDVEIFALMREGRAEGLLELDFRQAGACELAFFGLTRVLVGSGAGRFLMNHALSQAWARPISLFHVHTCTNDSPAALDFYRRSGFVPVRQQVEIADDPRLTGALPRAAAPHLPLLDPAKS